MYPGDIVHCIKLGTAFQCLNISLGRQNALVIKRVGVCIVKDLKGG